MIAGPTSKTRDTITGKVVDLISACGIVKTWRASTFIDVHFALFSSKAKGTGTTEISYKICTATIVLAWIGIAFIYFCKENRCGKVNVSNVVSFLAPLIVW